MIKSMQFDINTLIEVFEGKARLTDPDLLKKYLNRIKQLKSLKAIPDTLRGPTFVAFDFTYRCNICCKYCYISSPHNVDELETEEWKEVIDDLAKMGTFTICLTGGEPTIREDYLEIVEYASKKGLAVNTASNGLLIDEHFAREMKKSGICTVQISLDGSKADIHDKLRGKGTFEKAIMAIKNLVRENIPTAISFASTKFNIRDFPNVVSLAEKLGVNRVRTMYFLPMGRGKGMQPSNKDYKWLRQWIAKYNMSNNIFRERSVIVEFGDPIEHIKILPYLPTITFNITADGYVILSPYLPYVFGNVREDRVSDLWIKGLNRAWNLPAMRRISEMINHERDLTKFERTLSAPYIDLSKNL